MSMHISFKKIVAAIIIAALVVCIIAAAVHFTKPRTVTIAFYDVPDMTAAAVTKQIRHILETPASGVSGTLKLVPVTYSTAEPLSYYLKQKPLPDILFTFAGKSAQKAAAVSREQNAGLKSSVLQSMPASIQKTAILDDNGQVSAIPLLLDHYEIAVRRINPADGQFLFAGTDDRTVLALAGAIAEAVFGPEQAKQLASALEQTAITDNPLMHEIAKLIASGISSGKIPPYIFQITNNDIATLIENGTPGAVFMPLSFHRTVPLKGTEQYEAFFFPSFTGMGIKALTIPVLYGIPLAHKKDAVRTAETVLNGLISADIQYALSADAGLAPVHAYAETADIQASDVRYWAAATEILPPLGSAVFSSTQQQADAANQLRALVLEYVNADTP